MINGQPNWGKSCWRLAAREARKRLVLNAQDHNDLCAHFKNYVYEKDRLTAAYWPIGDELDTRPLLEYMAAQELSAALPRVSMDSASLLFHRWRWGDALEPSRFSLSEPEPRMETLCTPDIILLPLLAFDAQGTRLGYGAGHYDRTLAHSKAKKIGLAYAEQMTNFPLPHEKHDVRLDAVLTPQGLVRFHSDS